MRKIRAENEQLFLSKEEDKLNESHFDESTLTPKECHIENESNPDKPVPKPTGSATSVASNEKESHSDIDTETEQECNHCSLVLDHPYQIKEDDRIYINRQVGEVLIFPPDESQDESWIQECVINNKNVNKPGDSVFILNQTL